MNAPVTLFFDYVDPASFLQERVVERLLGGDRQLVRHPYEIQPPPRPLVDPEDEGWRRYWESTAELGRELGVEMTRPPITPWSRKAHELALHAREAERFDAVHRALFRAHALRGRDIGRVDVLVEIAEEEGLDPQETKAVLDVDRFSDRVVELRKEAERLGVRGVPTLQVDDRTLEGFHRGDSVRDFLSSS